MNIKFNVKLSAYTRGIIPDVSEFIKDAPADGKIYGRKDNNWVNIKDQILDQQIIVEKGSGLNLTQLEGNKQALSIRQQILNKLPDIFEDDTTYYIVENTPDLYINGGTAYSDGENEYVDVIEYGQIILGGANFVLDLLPTNNEGVYNGD